MEFKSLDQFDFDPSNANKVRDSLDKNVSPNRPRGFMFRRSRLSKSISGKAKPENTKENLEKAEADKILLKAHLKLEHNLPHFKDDI